jgi:hypothetical protein
MWRKVCYRRCWSLFLSVWRHSLTWRSVSSNVAAIITGGSQHSIWQYFLNHGKSWRLVVLGNWGGKSFRDNLTPEVNLDFFQGAFRHVSCRYFVENNGVSASGHLTHSHIFGKCWSRHWCWRSCGGKEASHAGTCQSTPHAHFRNLVNAMSTCSSPHALVLLADVSRQVMPFCREFETNR